MEIRRSPNGWSCLAASFATVLDLQVEAVFLMLGHDGSQVWWPDLAEPYRRRSFHIQELVHLSWGLGLAVTPFEAIPRSAGREGAEPICVDLSPSRLDRVMGASVGVATGLSASGRAHAVAWDGRECLDPGGRRYELAEFRLACFWAVSPRQSNQAEKFA